MLGTVQLRKGTLSVFLLLLFIFCLAMIGSTQYRASADSNQCKIILSIDRSGSISDSQWEQMGTQVQNLLRTGVTGIPSLYIAMWTFSHADPADDYNAPHGTDYIQAGAAGGLPAVAQQDALIKTIFGTNSFSVANRPLYTVRNGGTDYQQAFGYSADPNAGGAITANPAVQSVINGNPDGFVLITDGAPNYPGGVDGNSGLDNNDAALTAGRDARGRYSVPAYGAYVTDTPTGVPVGLAYTMNGPNDDVGPVDFGSIEGFLESKIAAACGTQAPPSYTVSPNVGPSFGLGNVITAGTQPQFDHTVLHSGDTTPSTDWKIYDVKIDPGTNVAEFPFFCGGNTYCDTNTADACQYLATVLRTATYPSNTCNASADAVHNGKGNSGTLINITQPTTDVDTQRPANVDISKLKPGARVCRVLRITNPNGSGNPAYRLSGFCFIYAKAPLLQIHGGDVRVGRAFDGNGPTDAGIYTNAYTLTGSAGSRTFGSWVEYGAVAPGPIISLASLAGYSGGAASAAGLCNQQATQRSANYLTFANSHEPDSENRCGLFTDTIGNIPDVVTPLKSFEYAVPNHDINSPFQLPTDESRAGRYETLGTNDVTITDSVIPKHGTYVIYAPYAKVIIDGNITYNDVNDKYATSELKNIPQVIIIAKNIDINSKVQHIDAWLVAIGDETDPNADGVINTCAELIATSDPTSICKDQLVINGPVMARELQPWRTTVFSGTCTIDAATLVDNNGCVKSPTNAVDKPGEVFILPGSSILWAISQGDFSRAQTTYTTELPPYY